LAVDKVIINITVISNCLFSGSQCINKE